MKKHILVISQYFYPEQFRINDICKEWVKKGYQVTVVTGIPNYPKGKYYEGYGLFEKRTEEYEGINIIRIPLVPRGNNSIMLSLNYLSFVFSGFIWKAITKVDADYVFIFEVSPMTQALPGVWYANKKDIPCYLYVQDLWPENVEIVTGIKNKSIIKMIGKMVDYIYKNCTKIFTSSRSFVDSINERGVDKDKIKFWPQYAEDFYEPLENVSTDLIPDDDYYNIIFAGNIGEAQGLDILPKAAGLIKEENLNKAIRFNIVGDGRYKEEFINIVKENNLDYMFNFIDRKPAYKIPELMAVNDFAFLSLSDNPLFKMTIPAKLQSYLACGMPVIASAGGEVKKIIDESNAGLCSPPGDEAKLANNIIKLINKTPKEIEELTNNAKNYNDNNFNKEDLLNEMDEYFQ